MAIYQVNNGRLLKPDGTELIATGLNGPVAIGTGAAFTIPSSVALAWAYEGYPGASFHLINDIWVDEDMMANGHLVLPGGTISPGQYWNHATLIDSGVPLTSTIVDLPDRTYALTGIRSTEAISFGIPEPEDHWHSRIYRINAHLRSGPLTWNGATSLGLTADVLAPQYVARARELVDLGILVSPEFHDMTAVIGRADYEVTPGLLADPTLSTTGMADGYLRDSLVFYDAMVAEFNGSEIVIGLMNEFNKDGRTTAYDDVIVTLVRRIRALGWDGVISIPLPRWAGDIGALARGELDTLMDRLESHSVGHNLVMEWHNWGDYYPSGGPQRAITYSDIDNDLAACRQGVAGSGRKYAVWMGEYGRPVPSGHPGTLPNAPLGVATMATTSLGPQALGEKYPWICPTWWAVGDNSFNVRYALTKGVSNKADENAADPNATGANNSLGPVNSGVFPWWKITSEALADEWLTEGGRAHWDLAHSLSLIASEVFPTTTIVGSSLVVGSFVYDPWEMEYNGVGFGNEYDISVESITGLQDLPDLVSGDQKLVREHGLYAGDDFLGGRAIQVTLKLHAETEADFNAQLRELKLLTSPGAPEKPLIFRVPGVMEGRKAFILARPRRRSLPVDWSYFHQSPTAVVEFFATDPRIYEFALNSHTITPVQVSGGMEFDAEFDLTFGAPPAGGIITAENTGDFATPVVMKLIGPLSVPRIWNKTQDKVIELGLTLPSGAILILDSKNRSILLNGTNSVYWSFGSSEWFNFAPGVNELEFRTTDTGLGTMTVEWRSASI